jgi:hypothetical protein
MISYMVIFLAAGIIIWKFLLFYFRSSAAHMPGMQKTYGKVIELETIAGANRKTASIPVVSFKTAAGELVTLRGNASGTTAHWQLGEMAELAYDPANPAAARLLKEQRNFSGIALAVVAVVVFVLVLAVIFFAFPVLLV